MNEMIARCDLRHDPTVLLVLGCRMLAITQRNARAFLLGSHYHAEIRRHAVAMNDLCTRRVIFCRGKTHRGTVRQLSHVLAGPFSKGGFADQDGTMQTL